MQCLPSCFIYTQVLQRILNARQFGLKLIANVTYGYTAAGFSGRMPLAELADSIVQVIPSALACSTNVTSPACACYCAEAGLKRSSDYLAFCIRWACSRGAVDALRDALAACPWHKSRVRAHLYRACEGWRTLILAVCSSGSNLVARMHGRAMLQSSRCAARKPQHRLCASLR